MYNILEYIKHNKEELIQTLLKEISEYEYRNSRYNVKFSLVAIYCENGCEIDFDTFKKTLRQTDKIIKINENIYCVVLDGISAEFCDKAAENINYNLLRLNVKNAYFMSAADSETYNPKYTNMIKSLLRRLEYAIENNLINIVVYQDYII